MCDEPWSSEVERRKAEILRGAHEAMSARVRRRVMARAGAAAVVVVAMGLGVWVWTDAGASQSVNDRLVVRGNRTADEPAVASETIDQTSGGRAHQSLWKMRDGGVWEYEGGVERVDTGGTPMPRVQIVRDDPGVVARYRVTSGPAAYTLAADEDVFAAAEQSGQDIGLARVNGRVLVASSTGLR